MPHDSAAIDLALTALLQDDAVLHAELPDGVFFDQARDGARRYVLISQFDQEDIAVYGGRAIERTLYLVKGIAMEGLPANLHTVERRIDELLDDGVLTVPGYVFMAMFRERRFPHTTERDDVLRSERWFHRGGFYRVDVSIDFAAVPSPLAQEGTVPAAAPATA